MKISLAPMDAREVEGPPRDFIGAGGLAASPAGAPDSFDGPMAGRQAIDLVGSAARRIRAYEQAFRTMSRRAKELTAKADAERSELTGQIHDLENRIATMEERHRATLAMLDDSLRNRWLLKLRVKELEENALTAEQDIRTTTTYLVRIVHILKALVQDGSAGQGELSKAAALLDRFKAPPA